MTSYICLFKGHIEMFWIYITCFITNWNYVSASVGLRVHLCRVCSKMSASAKLKGYRTTAALPQSMVSLKRTEGEGTGNTTCTAGYEWYFTCDLQSQSLSPAAHSAGSAWHGFRGNFRFSCKSMNNWAGWRQDLLVFNFFASRAVFPSTVRVTTTQI